MKNRLLITTALVAVAFSSQAFAEVKIIESFSGETKGTAILPIPNGTEATANNITVSKNTNNSDGMGGAIRVAKSTAKLTVTGGKFEKNTSIYDGGAIGNYGSLMIDGTEFSQNTSQTTSSDSGPIGGGAISLGTDSQTTIKNAKFNSNTTGFNGGAIATRRTLQPNEKPIGNLTENGNFLKISNSEFIKNEALGTTKDTKNGQKVGGYGGAIANTFETTEILGSTFTENKAKNGGGALYLTGFINDDPKGTATGKGGILSIKNSTFSSNESEQGGAIYNEGVLNVDGTYFAKNEAKFGGGAIFNVSKANIKGSAKFEGNTAQKSGGAIKNWVGGDLTVEDGVQFINNEAKEGSGGAIESHSKANLGNNLVFQGNKAAWGGAAISSGSNSGTEGYKLTIGDNAQFNNNTLTAENSYGGAIFLDNDGGKDASFILGEKATFTENKAQKGGAVYVKKGIKATIGDGAVFENNSATAAGGAVFLEGKEATLTLNSATFSGNKVGDELNDIHNEGTLTVAKGATIELDGGISGNGTTTFAKDSTLTVNTGTTTIANKVVNEGATLNLKLDNGFTGKYEMITTTGSLDKEFTITENNLYNIVADTSKAGTYNISKKSSDEVAAAVGATGNQASAITAVTSGNTANTTFNQIAENINSLMQSGNSADVKTALDASTALAPEVAPAVQSASTETTNQVFGAVGTRLSGGSISTGSEGMSSGDNIFERVAVWVQGLFNKSKLDDTSKAKGFDADSNGVAFGVEKYVTDDTKLGIGYAYTNTDIDGFMRTTDVDTHTAIVYGEYKPSRWFVNGIATYGWSDYSENKNVAGVGVNADYDVDTFGLQAMTGYEMNINGFGVTPEAGLRYVHIKQDSYKDSADQKVSANDSDILTGVIGAKISKNFELSNGVNLKPEARVAATYDLKNDDVNSVVTLANGSAYAVEGKALKRFGMEFGAGVTAEVNDSVELSLGYEGKFREDYQDHTGLINLKYKF